jgi:hypothetical protein
MNPLLKTYLSFSLLFLLSTGHNSFRSAQLVKPEKVYRIVYEIQTDEWYQQQAMLWKKEIDKNPANAEAWMNYYNANRYANFDNIDAKERQEKLNRIIEDMGKAIPNSYEFYVLKFKTSGDFKDISLIEKAYALNPERPDTYYDLLTFYAIKGETDKFDEFCEKLYRSKDIAPWLMNYNYNVLMSTEPNAILITNGDNDTYPAWLLQRVKGIRPDVTILNISLTSVQSYFEHTVNSKEIDLDYSAIQARAKKKAGSYYPAALMQEMVPELYKKYPQYPLYFALTVYPNYIEACKENLYAVGLAFRYNKKRMDNIALIKKNLEQNFVLDYLKFDYIGDQYPGKRLSAKMNLNYISPLMLLAEHYYLSGDVQRAQQWKNFALTLAEKDGNKETIEDIKNKF